MSIPSLVQGSTSPSINITFSRSDGAVLDITGATITGKMYALSSRTSKDITGVIALVTPASGIFSWSPSASDVNTADVYEVTFTATYGSGSIVKSFVETIEVRRSIS